MASSIRTLLAASLSVWVSSLAVAGQTAPQSYRMSLSNAQTSELPDGKLVVTMEATGDLKGLLTLTMNSSGTQVSGGEWAFVVRYVEYLDADGKVIPEDAPEVHSESEPHSERPRFVDRGTLAGSVRGGSLAIDDAGHVTGVGSLSIALESGSLTFRGASGTGASEASNIRDVLASSGLLTLVF